MGSRRFNIGFWITETLTTRFGGVSICHLSALEALLDVLLSPAGDNAWTWLNGERARRQLAAEKARMRAEREPAP